jgi:hypothetical protein
LSVAGWIRAVDKSLGLALGEPGAGAGALDLGAANIADSLRRHRVEQAVIGGFPGQLAQRRELLVDRSR